MKKKILLSIVPIIAIGSPILIASSCDNTTEDNYFEKRAKETDDKLKLVMLMNIFKKKIIFLMTLNNLSLIEKGILIDLILIQMFLIYIKILITITF